MRELADKEREKVQATDKLKKDMYRVFLHFSWRNITVSQNRRNKSLPFGAQKRINCHHKPSHGSPKSLAHDRTWIHFFFVFAKNIFSKNFYFYCEKIFSPEIFQKKNCIRVNRLKNYFSGIPSFRIKLAAWKETWRYTNRLNRNSLRDPIIVKNTDWKNYLNFLPFTVDQETFANHKRNRGTKRANEKTKG